MCLRTKSILYVWEDWEEDEIEELHLCDDNDEAASVQIVIIKHFLYTRTIKRNQNWIVERAFDCNYI